MKYNRWNKTTKIATILLALVVIVSSSLAFTNIQPAFAALQVVKGVSPSGLQKSNVPTFTWTRDAGNKATKFQLLLVKPDGTKWNSWYEVSALTKTSTTYAIKPGLALEKGTYSWRVRYSNGKSTSKWSATKTFKVTYKPEISVLLEPSGEISEQELVFKWESVADVTDYLLYVKTDSGVVYKSWLSGSDLNCVEEGGVCEFASPTTLTSDTYSWKVIARFMPDSATYYLGDWSPMLEFSLADVASQEEPITSIQEPTAVPTAEPTEEPTQAPTMEPTAEPTQVSTEQPAAESGVVFSSDFETGNLSEWLADNNGDFIAQGDGTYKVNTVQAHSGKYAAALTIDTSKSSSTGSHASYLFFWKDLPDDAYYYSAWYYIPENVTPQDWWNVWQWKHTYDGNSDRSVPTYVLDVRNNNGTYRLHLTYRPDLDSKINYTQTTMEVPTGKWFHIEGYYKESQTSSGQVIIWQDGVKIFDVTGNPTALSPYRLYFSVNNYTDSISPAPCTIYVDDMVISKNRVGEEFVP